MQFPLRYKPKPMFFLLLILIAAAGWKVLLLGMNAFPFNADEAVVGLMARHILQGERPIFFYGQAYMGSLDAFLVAGGFALLGQHVWVIRLVQILLYMGLILSTVLLGKEIFGNYGIGLIAGGLLSVPTVNMTLYTTVSLGGYGEALLTGNLIMLLTLRIANNIDRNPSATSTRVQWAGWGLLAGLGLWANGLTLVYSVPAGILLCVKVLKDNRRLGFRITVGWIGSAVLGFLVGAAPWWIYAFSNGWQSLFGELFGGAVAVEQETWVVRTFNHFISFFLLGGTVSIGLRPPWDVRWLAVPLLPFVLMGWAGIFLVSGKGFIKAKGMARTGGGLLLGVIGMLAAGFILTSFGVDPSGRYFLPLSIPLSLAAAYAVFRVDIAVVVKVILFCVLIIYQGWGTLESAVKPPGLTTQFNAITQIDTRYQEELIHFLSSQGEMRGYANYWVAYPTAFLSEEELIYSPQLPYHADLRYTSRDNRYPPYDELLAASEKTAYITTHNPALDEKLVQGFQQLGVSWQEKTIGDYRLYYLLSRAVRPAEIGLGNQP